MNLKGIQFLSFIIVLSCLKCQAQTNFTCVQNGLFAYNSCTQFYQCVFTNTSNAYKVLMACPSGTLFDQNLQVCNWASQVNCNSGGLTSIESTTTNKITNPNTLASSSKLTTSVFTIQPVSISTTKPASIKITSTTSQSVLTSTSKSTTITTSPKITSSTVKSSTSTAKSSAVTTSNKIITTIKQITTTTTTTSVKSILTSTTTLQLITCNININNFKYNLVDKETSLNTFSFTRALTIYQNPPIPSIWKWIKMLYGSNRFSSQKSITVLNSIEIRLMRIDFLIVFWFRLRIYPKYQPKNFWLQRFFLTFVHLSKNWKLNQ